MMTDEKNGKTSTCASMIFDSSTGFRQMFDKLLAGFDVALSGLLLTTGAHCPCAYVVWSSV